jgi:hypothetical protein
MLLLLLFKSYMVVVKILLNSKKDSKKTNQKDLIKMVGSKTTCPKGPFGVPFD